MRKINLIADISEIKENSDLEKLDFVDFFKMRFDKFDFNDIDLDNINQKLIISVENLQQAKESCNLTFKNIFIDTIKPDHGLIDYVTKNFKGYVHIKLNNATLQDFARVKNKSNNIVFYNVGHNKDGIYIDSRMAGFSNTEKEIFFSQAAVLAGCNFIEYKINKNIKIKDLKDFNNWLEENKGLIQKIKYRMKY